MRIKQIDNETYKLYDLLKDERLHLKSVFEDGASIIVAGLPHSYYSVKEFEMRGSWQSFAIIVKNNKKKINTFLPPIN